MFFFFRPKFPNDFQNHGISKTNGNHFKESMKSRTHLGFGGDGNYICLFLFINLYIVGVSLSHTVTSS